MDIPEWVRVDCHLSKQDRDLVERYMREKGVEDWEPADVIQIAIGPGLAALLDSNWIALSAEVERLDRALSESVEVSRRLAYKVTGSEADPEGPGPSQMARERDEARAIASDLLSMVNVMSCGERTFDRWQGHEKVVKAWSTASDAFQPCTFRLNGVERITQKPVITYEEIVTIEYGRALPGCSVTYGMGPAVNPEGILMPGRSVQVGPGMVFDACFTGNA